MICLQCEEKAYNSLQKLDEVIQDGWAGLLREQINDLLDSYGYGDQDIKADAGKPQLHLVPTEIINCIARVREFGNKKYGDSDSWRRVDKERYIDAMFRHLLKYVNDTDSVDKESGLPHLWHLACNVAFLCEMERE
jgi:hypothetical protein